ncbi:hypothetical protein AUO94_07175 [Planococcus kocurii]|uniref:DUF2812 domain-containing protein n=1 Tax=Planococcus kocurii TaxID=1374 RepID=A0ABM5WVV3_9BACL|nr:MULTISPECIES: DUF2812 domain-containing protein [Planococcus]ALS78457.1 hypothetical protein AUO94_07175 [Planococcus kocurii]MCH4826915.1 DUF2812 domain-containing protein [Planococcus halocryophilus]
MLEMKTIKKKFYIADFEEEQEFLSSLHNAGWRLTDIKGKRYSFEKCDKEAVIYQIDFNPKEQRKSEYVQLFIDFGWKFITEKDDRFYFSKPGLQCSEDQIFSDHETKMVMCRKIIKRKLAQLITLSVISIIISCVLAFNMFHYSLFPLGIIFIVSLIWLGALILTLYSTKYLTGFFKLKKIMDKSVN